MTRGVVGLLLGSVITLGAARASADPSKFECIEKHTSAQDLQHAGRLLAAREELAACSNPKCPAAVASECSTLARELDQLVPSIVIEGRDGAGRLVGIDSVTVDGQSVSLRTDAIELDPGRHKVVVTSGDRTTEQLVTVDKGEKRQRVSVVFGASEAIAPPPPRIMPREEKSSARPVVGLVLASVGVVAMGIGVTAGVVAKSDYDRAERSGCGPNGCTAVGKDETDSARSLGTAGTIVFATGAVALAVGLVVWLTAPSKSAHVSQTWIAPTGVRF